MAGLAQDTCTNLKLSIHKSACPKEISCISWKVAMFLWKGQMNYSEYWNCTLKLINVYHRHTIDKNVMLLRWWASSRKYKFNWIITNVHILWWYLYYLCNFLYDQYNFYHHSHYTDGDNNGHSRKIFTKKIILVIDTLQSTSRFDCSYSEVLN